MLLYINIEDMRSWLHAYRGALFIYYLVCSLSKRIVM